MHRQFIHYCIGYDRECQVFKQEDLTYVVHGISLESQEVISVETFPDIVSAIEWANQWI